MLGLLKDKPILLMYGNNQKPIISLSINQIGAPSLSIKDSKGVNRVISGILRGKAAVVLYDSNGKGVWGHISK